MKNTTQERIVMKKIELSQGKYTIVDDEDYDFIKLYKWHFHQGYAKGWVNNGKIKLQNYLLKPTKGFVVDHINNTPLDNRRENLRLVRPIENNRNRRMNGNNTSGFRGVYWYTPYGKWVARINVVKKKIHLGYFTDKTEAAKAYDQAAVKYYGEFAHVNLA